MSTPSRRSWRRRTVVLESVRPVEVPVVTETRRKVAEGEYPEAVRYAYGRVLADLTSAYGFRIEPHWTNQEIVTAAHQVPMGPIPVFLEQLLELYVPVRYGARAPGARPGALVSALLGIYSQRPMWYLYRDYVDRDRRSEHPQGTPPRPVLPLAPAPAEGVR